MRELKTICVLAYFAAGGSLLGSVGRSRLQWDEPPTPFRRMVVVAAWPLILLHNWRAFFQPTFPRQSPGDEGVFDPAHDGSEAQVELPRRRSR